MNEEKKALVNIEEKTVLSATDLITTVSLIQSVMKKVMKKGVHYGVIPGCAKPNLWKPGAEKLLMTFQIKVDTYIEDLSTSDEARFRVLAKGIYKPDGTELGSCYGECSSFEEKFKWNKALNDDHYNDTFENRRRIKYKREGNKVVPVKQIMVEKADASNTILKLAEKRAVTALVLRITAASDIFDPADYEDSKKPFANDIKENQEQEITQPQEKKESSDKKFECSQCKAEITEKVHKFSTDKLKKALCFTCQQTANGK